jgi:hypothetical protein
MAVIRKLWVAVGVELVANPGDAGLPVIGVGAQIDALTLLGITDRVLGPALGEREGDSLVGVGVLILVGARQQHRAHVDEPQRWIVFPARELSAAEIEQVAAGVQERMELLESPRDERAEMEHGAVLPERSERAPLAPSA